MYDANRLKFGGQQFIVWQEIGNNGVAEEALVITRFHDSISVQQRDGSITISDAAMPEVLKLLRMALKAEIEE